MCSIVGSFSLARLKELIELNAYRGQYRHSVLVIDSITGGLLRAARGKGAFTDYTAMERVDAYYIAHHQAPTAASSDYHPAWHNDDFLFHNGIVKERYLTQMKIDLDTNIEWDTRLLCMMIERYGFESLSKIDGSFAGVGRHKEDLYIFRNQLSPMFYNEQLDFSSTVEQDMIELPAETAFKFDFTKKQLVHDVRFNTNDNVYFFG